MYVALHTDIRLTDKFFDKKIIEKLKQDIENNNYFSNIPDISKMTTMQELLELFGLYISDIQDDEYHWCSFKAMIFDVKNIEKILKKYKECFFQYSKIGFIKPGSYDCLMFAYASGCLVEENLEYIIESDFDERFKISKKDGKYYRNKIRTSEFIETTASEIYEELMNGWSEDSNSYHLWKELGLWKCRYCVPIYDGVSIELFGYGHTKHEALDHCDKEFAKIRDQAIEEGYKEDNDDG